tara:strand:+ start:1295 stop:1666 length:372 start_codon:yes stop_codon:yes gene_type:complete
MLDLFAAVPTIATQDSGVSWGALLAILGGMSTVIMAIAGIAFNFIKATLGDLKREVVKTREDLSNLIARVDDKVEKVERDSRSARTNLWQEHRRLERDHDKMLAELETEMRVMNSARRMGVAE